LRLDQVIKETKQFFKKQKRKKKKKTTNQIPWNSVYGRGIFYRSFVDVDDVLYYQLVFLSIPCHLIEYSLLIIVVC